MWNLIPWKKNEGTGGGLMTTDPFEREFSRIRNEFDSLLQRMWGSGADFEDFPMSTLSNGLSTDETESHFIVRVAAPGFEVGDFDVHVSGNYLVIKAERKQSEDGKNGSRQFYGKVQRMIMLPKGIEPEQIEANYRNGLLEVKVPKGKESLVKKIAVKSA